MADRVLHPVLNPKAKPAQYTPRVRTMMQPPSSARRSKPSPRDEKMWHNPRPSPPSSAPIRREFRDRQRRFSLGLDDDLGFSVQNSHSATTPHASSVATEDTSAAAPDTLEMDKPNALKVDRPGFGTYPDQMKMFAMNDYVTRKVQQAERTGRLSREKFSKDAARSRRLVTALDSWPPSRSDPEYASMYAARAEAFYERAIRQVSLQGRPHTAPFSEPATKPATPAAAARLFTPQTGSRGAALLRSAGKKAMGKTSMWDIFTDKWGAAMARRGVSDPEAMKAMQTSFRSVTRGALDVATGNFAAAARRPTVPVDKKALMADRHRNHAKKAKAQPTTKRIPRDGTLRGEWSSFWKPDDVTHAPAFGGLGFQYDVTKGDSAKLAGGWDTQVEEAAATFDRQHHRYSHAAHKLLDKASDAKQSNELELRLFMLRSNRFTLQPLRLSTDKISPRTGTKLKARHNYDAPLALAVKRGGGPLIPVYDRKYATEIYKDELEDHCVSWLDNDKPVEEAEPEKELIWTLYGSIWGPRCEWCDGQDFFDHDEVCFERFAVDWQLALRLGVAKMIMDNDEDGKMDDDGDGVPDEVEDVGAVLLLNNQLYSLIYTFYADAIYGGGDLETGMKENAGWREFTENIGIWSHLNTAAAALKNNTVFAAVDRSDKTTAGAIAIQSSFRGHKARAERGSASAPSASNTGQEDSSEEAEAAEPAKRGKADAFESSVEDASRLAVEAALDKSNAITVKSDRQLSRAEFVAALVKLSIERYVFSKQNPKNPLKDVSDALEKIFSENISVALAQPAPGFLMPKIPMPDEFRESVCYTEEMSKTLKALAPSIRVMFGGLAQVSFQRSRTHPPKLPVPKKSKKETRVDEHEQTITWIVVPGLVSYKDWCQFITALKLKGVAQREAALCFVYSVMCVIDPTTDEGGIRERSLPFEGFLEALVRLATTLPIPTDEQLATPTESGTQYNHAGPYLSALAENNEVRFAALTKEQTCEWGDTPDSGRCGTMPRRMEHLLDIIIRRIKPNPPEGMEDEPCGVLTRAEFRNWAVTTMGVDAKELPNLWADSKGVGE